MGHESTSSCAPRPATPRWPISCGSCRGGSPAAT